MMSIREIEDLKKEMAIETERLSRKIEDNKSHLFAQRITALILAVPTIWVLRLIYDTSKMLGYF